MNFPEEENLCKKNKNVRNPENSVIVYLLFGPSFVLLLELQERLAKLVNKKYFFAPELRLRVFIN